MSTWVHLDTDVARRAGAHVTATVRKCSSALRQIRSVRRSVPRHALLTLIRSLVVGSVDYCNPVLAGVSGHLLDRLRSVLNAAARLIFSARKSEHITPLLSELYWLRVPERIQFRLCVLAYRCLHDTAPSYSSLRCFTEPPTSMVAAACVLPPRYLFYPLSRSSLGDRAFLVAVSRTWNSLPADVRDALFDGL